MANEIIHLIVQYCNDPRQERAAEYDECFRRNLANPWVQRVHNLVEPQTRVPEEFRSHPKYSSSTINRWMTFKDAIDYANMNLGGKLVCLTNLDIFLDAQQSDWQLAVEMTKNRIALCLGRWELGADGNVTVDPGLAKLAFANSQDAWVFCPPVNVPECDFPIGILGCDNAIAERFKRAGLLPLNAMRAFRVFHIDQVRGKSATNASEVHKHERPGDQPHPERQGQWLVPDFDQFRSLDELAEALKLTNLQKYDAVCNLLNRYRKAYRPD